MVFGTYFCTRLPVVSMRPAIVLAASLVSGQDKPAEVKQAAQEAVIIPVKTLSGDSFRRLINLLQVFKASYQGDEKLRTIVVYAPKDVVAQMRRVVRSWTALEARRRSVITSR